MNALTGFYARRSLFESKTSSEPESGAIGDSDRFCLPSSSFPGESYKSEHNLQKSWSENVAIGAFLRRDFICPRSCCMSTNCHSGMGEPARDDGGWTDSDREPLG